MAKKLKITAAKPPPRRWGSVFLLFFLGGIFLDLAAYLAFAWYTFPVVFLGSLCLNEAIPRKIGLWNSSETSAVFAAIATAAFFALRAWFPEEVRTWETMESPLRWLLP